MNNEARHCDDYDSHNCADNLVYRRSLGTGNQPPDQTNICDDHDAKPEFEICKLLLCFVYLRLEERLALQLLLNQTIILVTANAPAQPRRAHALAKSTLHLPPAVGCSG